MDILDIDEALKDDSFIFLADKTHDDVSNILQQWKTNNSGLSAQQNEQTYKLNSKTFTRPKRKSPMSLENQFQNQIPPTIGVQHGTTPLLNLEIGGFVTNMHKSFLQDTSPPPSILSSMELSMERMNNSLITSADFTNLNFLQSTQSLEFGNNENDMIPALNFSSKASADGYTLSDMIRDRKALESLTMSGDATLIKDSHIAQIDDISLTLSKTASGCSTMDNSTDSVGVVGSTCGGIEYSNQTIQVNSQRPHVHPQEGVLHNGQEVANVLMNHTMVLTEEMIGDMTVNLVENSIHGSSALNMTHDVLNAQVPSALGSENITFIKPDFPFDETVLINNNNNNNKINATFEYQSEDITPDGRCETPENLDKTLTAMRFCESTPLMTSVRHSRHNNKQQYTPTLKLIEDVNISPIVAQKFSGETQNATRIVLNNTYELQQRSSMTQPQPVSETASRPTCLPQFSESLEILDEIEIESPNETYNIPHMNIKGETTTQQQQAEDARKQMQCVMDLAEAEVELLAQQNDEEQFEHMLDKLGRVELNAEQLKMQKSLDSIKKRFNYGATNSSSYTTSMREISREAQDMRELTQHMHELLGEDLSAETEETNVKIDLNESTASQGARGGNKEPNNVVELKSSRELSSITSGSPHTSSTSSLLNGQNGERLLSRRSRLYDDVNLSMLSSNNGSNVNAKSSTNSTSFTVQKNCELATRETQEESETEAKLAQETEEPSKPMAAASDTPTCYRLTEKRERDRDRFKTIKITKQRKELVVGADGAELNVPCIDADDEHTKVAIDTNEVGGLGGAEDYVGANEEQKTQQRFSRRDRNTPEAVFNNNKSEIEQCKGSTAHSNYLTYKKPKDKLIKRNLPEILAPPFSECGTVPAAPITRLEPRSLSRPRYISGLQKFSVVSKATSAGDLPKTSTSKTTNVYGKSAQTRNHTQSKNATEALPGQGELKSPMGIKSKSFHNLSSNFGLGSGSGLAPPRASMSYGLRKLNNGTASNTSLDKQSKLGAFRGPTTSHASATERHDEGVFKVPKLGLRTPHAVNSSAGNVKRGISTGGLARPSSGYYSMNVTGNKTTSTQQQSAVEVEIEPTGRHSPTESLSSASSRGSLYGVGIGIGAGAGNSAKQTIGSGSKALDTNALLTAKLTQVTTGATGIPKPSGLRQPSNIKRSGLPRPSSIVRR